MGKPQKIGSGSRRRSWTGLSGELPGVTGGQPVTAEKLQLARKLRREITPAENTIWDALRDGRLLGMRFRRQQVIAGYVVDFYCASARLAIELDGPSHDAQIQYDRERDRALAEMGIETLRITNNSVFTDLPSVLRAIGERAVAGRR